MNDNNGNNSHGIKTIKAKNNNSHGIKEHGINGIIKGQGNKGNSRLKTDIKATVIKDNEKPENTFIEATGNNASWFSVLSVPRRLMTALKP